MRTRGVNNLIAFRVLAFMLFTISSMYAQGSVQLLNLSFPQTNIENGDYVEVSITGAPANGTVSLVQNGGSPYTWPTLTDASGNWSVTALELSANVGNYSQIWYVNGTALTPNNPSGFSVFAPTLPNFAVYAAGTPSSPSVLTVSSCGQPAATLKWIWTPVSYYVTSSYGTSPVNVAANRWNTAQSLITLQASTSVYDITVADGTLAINVYGQTTITSQACDTSCFNKPSLCTGACDNSQAIYYTNMVLNATVINDTAAAWGVTDATLAADIVGHEIGHDFGLADIYPADDGCSLSGSTMSNGPRLLCGIYGPTSRDIATFNTVYPTGPGYCLPGYNYCNPFGSSCS